MKKPKEDAEKWITILDGENMLSTVADLQGLTGDEWKELGVPLGLVKHIKNKLAASIVDDES